MNLQSNDFELFGLNPTFAQDKTVLESRWKELQRQAHPDKFAGQGEAAQRIAMQWSVRINEGYQRLKDPLRRAAYLCELAGSPVNAHDNTAMPSAFLMQQMEWRERLEDAQDVQTVDALSVEVMAIQSQMVQQCAQLIDAAKDFGAAVGVVRSLMFIEKFLRDLSLRVEAFDG